MALADGGRFNGGPVVIRLGAHVGFKTLNVVRRRTAAEDILAMGGPR